MAGKSKVFIYSTLSAAVVYRSFKQTGGDVPVAGDGIRIEGGAGVQGSDFVTPMGVATQVTSEQLEILRSDPVFLLHEKNGFITVSDHQVDPEVAASDMESRDASAQVTEQDVNAAAEAAGLDKPEVTTSKNTRNRA